jgi:type I restriction enzyme S subunit
MRTYKLKELLSIKNGKDHKELNDGNFPIFGSGGIMRFGDRAIYNDESILLPRKGTLSNIQYVNKPFWTVDTIYYSIINKSLASPFYLFNYIKSLDLSKLNSGTGVPSMTFDSYYNLDILLPELETQEKIASVLSALDSKIELNNRINAELEAMAKTLYDYWFVQFDFPDKNGKPYKTSGGKMVWNEELKREIPEGWGVNTLADWIRNDKSGDWGKEAREGNYSERVFCIRGADLNGLNGNGEVKAPERFILEKNSHKILEPHDFIVEISGGSPTQSTGRMAYITNETLDRFNAPIICSNFCKAVTLKDEKSLFNFSFEWNKAYDHGVLFGYEGKTSGIKNLLFESFVTSYFTTKAPKHLMEKFYDFMTPLERRKQMNLKENQQLAELRDWLLPMLMNGQVRIDKLNDHDEHLNIAAEEHKKYR